MTGDTGETLSVLTNVATQIGIPSTLLILLNALLNRRKNRSDNGKTDAERDQIVVGTALDAIPHLRTEILDLQREVETLRRQVHDLNSEVETQRVARVTAEDERDRALAQLKLREV